MPPPAALACGRTLYSRAASAVLRLGNRAFAAHARWYTLGLAAVFVVGAVSRHILAQNGSGESYNYSYLPYLPYIGQRLGEEGRGALQFRSFPTEPAELKEVMEALNHVCRETDEAEQPFVQVRPQLYQCAPCLLVMHVPLQRTRTLPCLLGPGGGAAASYACDKACAERATCALRQGAAAGAPAGWHASGRLHLPRPAAALPGGTGAQPGAQPACCAAFVVLFIVATSCWNAFSVFHAMYQCKHCSATHKHSRHVCSLTSLSLSLCNS